MISAGRSRSTAQAIAESARAAFGATYAFAEKTRVQGPERPSVLSLGSAAAGRAQAPTLELPQIPGRSRRRADRRLSRRSADPIGPQLVRRSAQELQPRLSRRPAGRGIPDAGRLAIRWPGGIALGVRATERDARCIRRISPARISRPIALLDRGPMSRILTVAAAQLGPIQKAETREAVDRADDQADGSRQGARAPT